MSLLDWKVEVFLVKISICKDVLHLKLGYEIVYLCITSAFHYALRLVTPANRETYICELLVKGAPFDLIGLVLWTVELADSKTSELCVRDIRAFQIIVVARLA